MASFCSGRHTRDIPAQREIKAFRRSLTCPSFSQEITSSSRSRLERLEEKLTLYERHQSICNLPHQSEPPSIWCTGLANEQALRAGVFSPPLPLHYCPFFYLTPTPSEYISSPQSSTVTKSKMAAIKRKCALARPKYACTAG